MRLTWKAARIAMVAVVAMAAGTFASARADGLEPPTCPEDGHVSYTLHRVVNPTPDQSSAYVAIDTAMKQAVAFYNCYTNVTKALQVSYDPSVSTAKGSRSGLIWFGSHPHMQQITAMHEIAHTLGVGTDPRWREHVSGGVWTGPKALQVLRVLDNNPSAVLYADNLHFWPYGLNSPKETVSEVDLIEHCRIVDALLRDMGL